MGNAILMNALALIRQVLLPVAMVVLVSGCAPKQAVSLEAIPKRFETVTVERLNLRQEPSTESEILRMLVNGEKVEVEQLEGPWVKVLTAENETGWVHAPGHLTGFTEMETEPAEAKRPVKKKAVSGRKKTGSRAGKENEKSEGAGASSEKPNELFYGSESDISAAPKDPFLMPDKVAAPLDEGAGRVDQTQARTEEGPSSSRISAAQQAAPASDQDLGSRQGTMGAQPTGSNSPQQLPSEVPSEPNAEGVAAVLVEGREDIEKLTGNQIAQLKTIIVKAQPGQETVSIKSGPAPVVTLAEVKPGTRLQSYGKEGKWYKVKIGRGMGYLHEDFVQEVDN